jgi:nicotinamidase-related amidase
MKLNKYPLAARVFVKMEENPNTVTKSMATKMKIDNLGIVSKKPDENGQGGIGWEYHKVKPKEGDIEVIKEGNYDLFYKGDLHQQLQDLGVETLIIIGAYTDVCVTLSGITAASNYGYNVFIPPDTTGVLDGPEHDPGTLPPVLQTFNIVFGYVPPSSAILKTWEKLNRKNQAGSSGVLIGHVNIVDA